MANSSKEALEEFIEKSIIPSMEETEVSNIEINGVKESMLDIFPNVEARNPGYYFTVLNGSAHPKSIAFEDGFHCSGIVEYTVVLRKKDREGR